MAATAMDGKEGRRKVLKALRVPAARDSRVFACRMPDRQNSEDKENRDEQRPAAPSVGNLEKSQASSPGLPTRGLAGNEVPLSTRARPLAEASTSARAPTDLPRSTGLAPAFGLDQLPLRSLRDSLSQLLEGPGCKLNQLSAQDLDSSAWCALVRPAGADASADLVWEGGVDEENAWRRASFASPIRRFSFSQPSEPSILSPPRAVHAGGDSAARHGSEMWPGRFSVGSSSPRRVIKLVSICIELLSMSSLLLPVIATLCSDDSSVASPVECHDSW